MDCINLIIFSICIFEVLPAGLELISIAHSSSGPSLDAVASALRKSGIMDVEFKTISSSLSSPSSSSSIVNFIKQVDQPVFILHNPDPDNNIEVHRRLTNTSDAGTSPPTEYEISAYQIGLWTTIGMIILIGGAVSALSDMEIIPDSLLFAKFQSSRTNKID